MGQMRTAMPNLILLLLATVLLLGKSAAKPKEFYIELVGDTDSLQVASLKFAIDETNAHTSNQSKNSFTLKITNASQHQSLHQHAAALLQQDVVALIDGNHPSDRACILSMFTQIPLLRHHGNHGDWDECKDMGVSLSASPDSYAYATVGLLETFHWVEVTILYEDIFTRAAHHLGTALANYEETISTHLLMVYKLKNETIDDSLTRTVKQLSTFNSQAILLYVGEFYQRKLLSKIPADLTAHPQDTIIGFRLPRERKPAWEDYGARLQSSPVGGKTDFLSLKDDLVLKHDAGRIIAQALADLSNASDWVRMVNGTSQYAPLSNRALFLEYLKKARVEGITGMIQFDKSGVRHAPDLDVINLQNSSRVKVGSWNSGKLTFTKDLANAEASTGSGALQGRRLRIVTVELSPYVLSNGTKIVGFCIDVLNHLSKELKFTYEIRRVADGKFGAITDGGWNGMIGDLVRKKADMAVAPLTVTAERETAVDFTVALTASTTHMLLRKDMVEKDDYMQFMTPLQAPVWIMVIVCQLVVTAAVYILNYYSPYGHKDEEGRGTSSEFSLFNSLWFSLACLLQQGGDNTPKATSGRLLVGCYWVCVLVLVSTYTANLAAFLTTKYQELPISTLEEALERGYDIGVASSTSYAEFFRQGNSEFYQKVWNHMNSRNTFAKNGNDGIERARKGKYVFVDDGFFLEYVAGHEPCDLMTLPALPQKETLAFALQENDPVVKAINLVMLGMRHDGSLKRLEQKWLHVANRCSKPTATVTGKQVNLEMVAGVFIVLAVGLLLSFGVLGVEIMWHQRNRENLGQPDEIEQDDIALDVPAVDTSAR